jgi:Zn-dependent peptidase ImmA (M78 family)
MISGNRKREVTRAATRLLSLGKIDMTQQIDVFGLIRQSGLVLRFMDLDRLLGAFVPGDPAGVVVNAKLPAALQRYTAAHELAHYSLHAETFALDGQSEIDGRTPDHLESEAQLFASHLLMPLPLMSRAARDAGIRRGTAPTDEQVYAVAGIVGVSYAAALVQLRNLNLISQTHVGALQAVRPLSVQLKRTFGERVAKPGTHVWSQDEVAQGKVPDIFVGDLVAVDLPENRTTGYRWFISAPSEAPDTEADENEDPRSPTALDRFHLDPARLELPAGSSSNMLSSKIIGAGGRRQILIRANTEGRWKATLSYAPVHTPSKPIESLVVEGQLHLRPKDEQRRILVEKYRAIASEGTA